MRGESLNPDESASDTRPEAPSQESGNVIQHLVGDPAVHAAGGPRRRLVLGLVLMLAATAATLQLANMVYAVAEDPDVTWAVPVSDLGRDVIGSRASRDGGVPYGRLGDLDGSVPSEVRAWWVAHTPVAVAVAAALDSWTASPDRTARALTIVGLVGVAFALAAAGGRGFRGLLLLAAGLAVIPAWTDFIWVQLGTLTAMGLLAVFGLDSRGWRRTAPVLLGVLIAWRPWLAPVALALPPRGRLWRDLWWVAIGGAGATLLALPWVGGWEGVVVWLTVAAPANLAQYRQTIGNLSVTQWMDPLPAWILFGVGYATVALARIHFDRGLRLVWASVVIFTLSLLVWSHYWSVLLAVLIPAMRGSRRWRDLGSVVVGIFSGAMLLVLTGLSPLAPAVNLAGAGAVVVLAIGLCRELVASPTSSPEGEVSDRAVPVSVPGMG